MRDIGVKLGRVEALIAGWDARGEVDELERDLALGLLREVYSALKFGDHATVSETPDTAALISGPESEIAPESAPGSPPVEGWQPQADGMVPSTEPESAIPIIPKRVSSEVIRSLYGIEDESAPEQEQEPEPETLAGGSEAEECSEGAEDDAIGSRSEPRAGLHDIRDFADSQHLPPVGSSRSPETPGTAAIISEPEPEPIPVPTPAPRPEPRPEPVSRPEPRPAPRPDPILGEAMSKGQKTLGETLRTPGKGDRDMAAHIAAAQAAHKPGLKRSIGLNDRFLMIRDMFSGDADAFDRAITRLDAFTDLDEAVIWIRENFDWRADSQGVELLIGLLERKLGR
jgi:hypothetical protein